MEYFFWRFGDLKKQIALPKKKPPLAIVQPNILFSILSFYTVLFPSLLCRALLCTKSQFETGDCTHFDLFQLYSQVCIFPSSSRTVRVCEAVHALAHVRTPEAHQPSKHAV